MADEKKAVVKNEPAGKPNIFVRIGQWCVNLCKRIGKAFKDMWTELKRVTWPTKRKLMIYSAVVLVFMLFMAVVIGLFDLGSSALVKLIRIG